MTAFPLREKRRGELIGQEARGLVVQERVVGALWQYGKEMVAIGLELNRNAGYGHEG